MKKQSENDFLRSQIDLNMQEKETEELIKIGKKTI